MIRLATAHAKSRLQRTVEQTDAQAACDMVQFALFKKVEKRKKKRNVDEDDHMSNGNGAPMDVDEAEAAPSQPVDPDDPYRFGSSELTPKRTAARRNQTVPGRADTVKVPAAARSTVSADKYKVFRELVGKRFHESHQQSLSQNQLVQAVAEKAEAQGVLHP